MEKNQTLCPILALRAEALKQINPDYYAENEKWIILSSLVVQDMLELIVNGEPLSEKMIDDLHTRRGLDRGGDINPFLVNELAQAMQKDISFFIDEEGNIINKNSVKNAKVMTVCHNSIRNGVPKDAPMFL